MPRLSILLPSRRPRSTLVALAVMFSLAGCQAQSKPESPPAPMPGSVVLGFGDEVTVASATQLRFVRVVNDSRCPKGVQCVWAGEVKIEFELTSPSGKTRFELASSRSPGTAVGLMQFELKDYGACPPGSNRLADAECATVAITTAATR